MILSMKKGSRLKRYLNPVAQLHLLSPAPYSVLIAGRGFSKSFTNGVKQARKLAMMPKSCGLFNSPTYSMIYTKTLIPMMAAWEQHFGYVEGVHYVVGKPPPKWFEKPWHKPMRYENAVSWWNGRIVIFGSFDRPALLSGGSYDDVDTDEAYLIDKEDYDNFVIPSMRPTHPSFKGKELHLQQTFTSSMPFQGNGDWLLDFLPKSKTNPEMYSFIGWEPNVKMQTGSSWMNIEVLGRKTLMQWKAEMQEHSYKVMVLNQQVSSFGNTFYPALGPKHFYTAQANDRLVSVPINLLNKLERDARYDVGADDYDPDKPINISHDFGKFNCITIDQEYRDEIRIINTMHVFNEGENRKDLNDMADDFCNYYKHHKTKLVYQWGDKSGKDTRADSKLNYFEQFAERLRKQGWRVIMKKTGDIDHMERFRFINNLFEEKDPRYPRIRINSKCSDFRIAMESAGMRGDEKDKRSERNASIKQEHATHYTDAFDYRIYHGLKNREKEYAGDPYSTSLD
jgi:hypothetical protein